MSGLDFNYMSRNHEEGEGTDLEGLQAPVVEGFNNVAREYYEATGDTLLITGGNELGVHSGGPNGHEGGWKLDIAKTTTGGSEVDSGLLASLLDKYNVAGGDEGDHFDLSWNSAGGVGGTPINSASGGSYDASSMVPEGFADSEFFGQTIADNWKAPTSYINEADWSGVKELQGDSGTFGDKFLDAWYNNGTVNMLRTGWALAKSGGRDYDAPAKYTPDDDERKSVYEMFKDTPEVADSIINNAETQNHFYELIKMRQEDVARHERVENSQYGVSTLGTIAGTLLDPINFIPYVGEVGIGAKLAGSLGLKTLAKLGSSRVANMTQVALQNGTLNVLDSELNQQATGQNYNPAEAFLLGAGASAGIEFLRGVVKNGKNIGDNLKQFQDEQEAVAERALMSGSGNRLEPNNLLPQEVPTTLSEKVDMEPSAYATHLLSNYKSPEYEEAFATYQGLYPNRTRKNFNQTLKSMESSNKTLAETISGYKVINGVPNSPKSMITHMDEGAPEFNDYTAFISRGDKIEDKAKEIRQASQGDLPEFLQKLGQKVDTFGFTGDRFGSLINSPAKSVRDFAQTFLVDPRQRNISKRNSVELYKKVAKQELDTHISRVLDNYAKFGTSRGRLFGTEALYQDFSETLYDAYNLKYRKGVNISDFPEEIQDAVEALHDFRKAENKTLRQAGIIDFENEDDAKELWRSVDKSKLNYLRTQFKDTEELHNFLADYFEAFADKSALDTETPLRDQALAWARYITDDTESILGEHGDKFMSYYKTRIPMDTDGYLQMPNGDLFSFDDMLRDKDLVNTMKYVSNRSSGAVGLRLGANIQNIGTDLRDIYQTAQSELEGYVQKGLMTRKEALDQLEDIRTVMHKVSGAIIHEQDMKAQGALEKITNILLANSYAQNGMNMGTAQLGESIGSVSVAGAKALTHYIPKLHDFLHDLIDSKYVSSAQLRDFLDKKVGYELAEHIWFNPELKGVDQLAMNKAGVGMKALGYLEKGVNVMSNITSTLNQLTHMTGLSRNGIKGDVMADMLKWARGDFKSWLRDDLFDERNLAEVGITDVQKFKDDLNKYLGNLGHETTALTDALDKWKEDDIAGYYRMLSFLDTTANRAILEPNLGNGTSATNSPIAKILFQFKNFTRMATNGHLMRALSNPTKSALMMTLSTALSGGLIWAVRTALMANANMPEDKRKAYLEKTLTPENLIRAGIFRGSLTGALSPLNDGYEALTGASTIRTTVNRSKSSGDAISDFIAQTPAIASIGRTLDGFKSIGQLAYDLDSKGEPSDKQKKAIERLFPIDRYVLLQGILAGLNDDIDEAEEQETFLSQFRNNKGE